MNKDFYNLVFQYVLATTFETAEPMFNNDQFKLYVDILNTCKRLYGHFNEKTTEEWKEATNVVSGLEKGAFKWLI